MATFFGEVLPVTSRAVDDDEEEEEDLVGDGPRAIMMWTSKIQMEIAEAADGKIKMATLIIAIGPAATGFVEAYILNDSYEIVGGMFVGMKDEKPGTIGQKGTTDKTCYVYRTNDNPSVYVCQCRHDVHTEEAYSWVSKFFADVDLSECYVGVLASAHISEFKSPVATSELTVPFLRGLKTTNSSGNPSCPLLEQPNIFTGLPAQIMTYCQVFKARALLYTCYTDCSRLDFKTIKSFVPLLRATPLKDIFEANPKAEQLVCKIIAQHEDYSTLYI